MERRFRGSGRRTTELQAEVTDASRIPAFVNPESGTADKARDALEHAGLFDIREVPPTS